MYRVRTPGSGRSLVAVVARIAAALAAVMLLTAAAGPPAPAGALAPAGAPATVGPPGAAAGRVDVHFFQGEGCPYCAKEELFLADLVAEFPNVVVHSYEVYNDAANRELLFAVAAAYGGQVTGVPVTFIGDYAWTGFGDSTAGEIRAVVERYSDTGAPDLVSRLRGGPAQPDQRLVAPGSSQQPGQPQPTGVGPEAAALPATSVLEVPLLGTVDLGNRSLWLATTSVALVDGFNPCSLWVMALLLAVVMNTRSRRRVLLVGLTFLSVAALAYALFIAGLFSAFALVAFAGWIRAAVAVIALAYAAVGIKDYFALKQGLSFTIDDAHKPRIYRGIRSVMSSTASVPATMLATGGMALGVTLVELPCTAGLPVLWTQLVGAAAVPASTFGLLLLLYMVVYLIDELAVFSVAAITMRVARVTDRETRVLKLVGGCVMLGLALAMLLRPTLLESVTGTVVVFGIGAGVALATLLVHRLVAPASAPLESA